MGNKIHTVIFDLDGTLSDSALLTVEAFRNIVPAFDLPMPSDDAIRRAIGYAVPEFFYILFPDSPKDRVDEMGKMVEEEELRLFPSYHDRILFPGCRELLERLKENRFRLNIASTGSGEHVETTLKVAGIAGFFDAISAGNPNKTEALREMIQGDDKAGYIMVGDMKKDYDAARENGILSAGACYGYCRREAAHFDYYIDTPLDLLNITMRKE